MGGELVALGLSPERFTGSDTRPSGWNVYE